MSGGSELEEAEISLDCLFLLIVTLTLGEWMLAWRWHMPGSFHMNGVLLFQTPTRQGSWDFLTALRQNWEKRAQCLLWWTRSVLLYYLKYPKEDIEKCLKLGWLLTATKPSFWKIILSDCSFGSRQQKGRWYGPATLAPRLGFKYLDEQQIAMFICFEIKLGNYFNFQ